MMNHFVWSNLSTHLLPFFVLSVLATTIVGLAVAKHPTLINNGLFHTSLFVLFLLMVVSKVIEMELEELYNISDFSYKWGFFFILLGFCFPFFLSKSTRELEYWLPERLSLTTFLLLFWIVMFGLSSLFGFILSLEMCNLFIMGVFVYIGLTTLNTFLYPQFNTTNRQTHLISALMLFMWASAFALMFMLWAATFYFPCNVSQKFRMYAAINTLYLKKRPFDSLNALIFTLGLFLKTMIVPWQSLMFAFYTSLPLQAFTSYLVLYYVGFLSILITNIFISFAFILTINMFFITIFFVSLITFLTLSVMRSVDFRAALAVSSIISMLFLFAGSLYAL